MSAGKDIKILKIVSTKFETIFNVQFSIFNMRRIITILLLTAATVTASAQFRYGLKAGLNVTDMTFRSDVFQASNNKGFFVGPTAWLSLPIVGLGVDASLLYGQNTAEFLGIANEDQRVTQKTLSLPVNLRYDVGLESILSCYVFGGPQLGFNVGGTDFNWKDTSNYALKKSEFSVNLGFGIILLSHLQVSATYNIACGRTVDITRDAIIDELAEQAKDYHSKSRNNIWQIAATVYF